MGATRSKKQPVVADRERGKSAWFSDSMVVGGVNHAVEHCSFFDWTGQAGRQGGGRKAPTACAETPPIRAGRGSEACAAEYRPSRVPDTCLSAFFAPRGAATASNLAKADLAVGRLVVEPCAVPCAGGQFILIPSGSTTAPQLHRSTAPCLQPRQLQQLHHAANPHLTPTISEHKTAQMFEAVRKLILDDPSLEAS